MATNRKCFVCLVALYLLLLQLLFLGVYMWINFTGEAPQPPLRIRDTVLQ